MKLGSGYASGRSLAVLEVERWGVVEGLRLAWEVGIRVVLLEVDNGDVARTVQDKAQVSGLHGLVPTTRFVTRIFLMPHATVVTLIHDDVAPILGVV
ncbi:hypothetical protein V6N13_083937 [Hibiscus sabdariffa]